MNPHYTTVKDMADYCLSHNCKGEKCKYRIYCMAFRKKYRKIPSRSAIGGYYSVGDYAYEKNEKLIELFLNKDDM